MGGTDWLTRLERQQEEREDAVMAARLRRTDVDVLANLIREVDGNHDLGAGALAEKLYDRGVRVTS